MTVLVWDGHTLATDRQANDGSAKWEADKAWYITDPVDNKIAIVSGVGILEDILKMREWYKQGATQESFPELHGKSQLIVVRRETGLWVYESVPHPVHYGFNPHAFGHGKDFAYGALAMGASAKEAVDASNMFCLHTGKGIGVYNLHGEHDGTEV